MCIEFTPLLLFSWKQVLKTWVCKVKNVEEKAQFLKTENLQKSDVILLSIWSLNALHAWDQSINPLFLETLPILKDINRWTRIINPVAFSMSVSRKHFPTRLYYIFMPCHSLCMYQVENVVGNVFWPNITLFWKTTSSTNHSYSDTS